MNRVGEVWSEREYRTVQGELEFVYLVLRSFPSLPSRNFSDYRHQTLVTTSDGSMFLDEISESSFQDPDYYGLKRLA